MSDEGVGLAGWLLADLVLVLALVFLSFTPAALSDDLDAAQTTATPIAAEPPVEAPRILDLGCEQDERVAGVIPVRCKPRLGGGEVNSHSWEADRGRAFSYTGSDYFIAGFVDAGAVRLTVSNEGGEHSAAFPVLPPPATETPDADHPAGDRRHRLRRGRLAPGARPRSVAGPKSRVARARRTPGVPSAASPQDRYASPRSPRRSRTLGLSGSRSRTKAALCSPPSPCSLRAW